VATANVRIAIEYLLLLADCLPTAQDQGCTAEPFKIVLYLIPLPTNVSAFHRQAKSIAALIAEIPIALAAPTTLTRALRVYHHGTLAM
jgi:hypothetical protein